MVSNTEKILAATALLVLVAVAFVFGYYAGLGAPRVPVQNLSNGNYLHLMIDYGNGTVSTYHFPQNQDKNTTAFTLLLKASEKEGFTVERQEYDFGTLVTGINDVRGGDKQNYYWLYWVNAEMPDNAADLHPVHGGDVVEFKYGYVEWS